MKTFTPQEIEEFVTYWHKRPFGESCQDGPGILITALMNLTDVITYLEMLEFGVFLLERVGMFREDHVNRRGHTLSALCAFEASQKDSQP